MKNQWIHPILKCLSKKLLFGFLVLACSNAPIFGQEKKEEGAFAPFVDSVVVKQQTPTPKLSPEEKKAAGERKAENANKSAPPQQDAPSYSPDDYSLPQVNLPPAVDYQKEAQKLMRQSELDRQKENAEAQRQINEMEQQRQADDAERQQYQDQILQQQQERENSAAAQSRQEEAKAEQREAAAQKIINEQSKWFWLIPLFELFQTAGLAFIAFRKKIAKKSVIVMITGLMITFFLLLAARILVNTPVEQLATASNFQLFGFGMLGAVLAVFGIYGFIAGKISSYIIVSLSPKPLTAKLLAVFGAGLSLIVLYLFLNSIAGFGLYGVFSGVAVMFIGAIVAAVKGMKGDKDELHGSARFAEKKDFKEFENEAEAGAFILAPAHPDGQHGKIALSRGLSVMHGLILGGSGTGKSRGFFMPNLAEVKNTSLVVTDPKSELWKYTSGYHDKALKYAPTEPDASQCFNWIPLCNDARMSELCARALMTAGSTGNTDQFWIDAETAFLSAIFAHTATTKYPTPLTAYRLFTRQKPEELMQQLLHSPSYVAREQAIVFEQTDARIKGAIVPAIASRLQFMRDPNLQLFTSSSLEAPNFGQLRRTPTAVYWCLREQDIARLRPLTSLFFTVLLEQIAGEEISEGEEATPITMMLDEFANIGKIPDFETTISLARGRGVALWLGVQSLSQFKQTYGEHAAQTIMSNCATKVALHGLDYQTAEYVSKMLGETTIKHSRSSFNIGLSGASVGTGGAEHRRQLLTPDEVMRIGENEAVARTSNKYPMRIYKGYYDAPPKTYPITQSLTKIYVEENEPAEDLAL